MPQHRVAHEREGGRESSPAVDIDGRRTIETLIDEVQASDSDQSDRELSRDDIFDILYNSRRRKVLRYLRENEGTATASELAEFIAAEENDTTVEQLSSYDRKSVYVGLYQNHLPKMATAGVIDYNKNRGTVTMRKEADQVEAYLESTVDSGYRRLKGVGMVGLAALVAVGALQLGPFAIVPPVVWIGTGILGIISIASMDVIRALR